MPLNIEMIVIIVTTLVLNVLSQQNPNFFQRQDYEYRDSAPRSPYPGSNSKLFEDQYRDLPQRNPFPGGNTKFLDDQYQDLTNPHQYRGSPPRTRRPFQAPNSKAKEEKMIEDKLSKVDPAIFKELDQQLLKYNKYDEFKKLTDYIKEKSLKDPSRTIEDEVMEALQWARSLDKPQLNKRGPQLQPRGSNLYKNHKLSNLDPSPGMNAYWAPQKKSLPPNLGANNQKTLTGRQVMTLALQKLESIDAISKKSPMEKFPEVMNSLPKSLPTDLLQAPKEMVTPNNQKYWQKLDDFNSPVRWVSIDSHDTGDGLAKVTDPRTGRNQQYILNGSVFVPITDYNIERLGLTSTTHSPVLTTDKRVLRTVQESVNFNNVDERDWLAFQTVLGDRNESNQCDGDSCQSRCKTLACESFCTGDTCAAGCIGGHCNTFCQGPGCLSMCIGDSCTAKCKGLACDTRCRGKNCGAECSTFSCTYAINGQSGRGGATWGEHYPQYDDRNIRNTQY